MKQPKDTRRKVCRGCYSAKRAEDVVVLGVGHLTSIADYFVIASGRNALARCARWRRKWRKARRRRGWRHAP
jgi:ribosomal silencing factor RsfS